MTTANLYRRLRWIDVEYALNAAFRPELYKPVHERDRETLMDKLKNFYHENPEDSHPPQTYKATHTIDTYSGGKLTGTQTFVTSPTAIYTLNRLDWVFASEHKVDEKTQDTHTKGRQYVLGVMIEDFKKQDEEANAE